MPHPSTKDFEKMVALASAWVADLEQTVLRDGISLDEGQLRAARMIGVAHAEKVRVLRVPQIPMPEHPVLRAVCESTDALGPRTRALSARYGILVRADRWIERDLVVHELVHTSQYEKLGGIEKFLRQYLHECLTIGYPQASMEQEAILTTVKIFANLKIV